MEGGPATNKTSRAFPIRDKMPLFDLRVEFVTGWVTEA